MLKKMAVAVVAAGGLMIAAAPAHAAHVGVSVGIGLPAIGIGFAAPAPAYYGPPPVVYAPPVVYQPAPYPYYAPVYYGGYYGRGYYGPRVVYRGGYGGYWHHDGRR
jgi:hypothetical protein